MNNHTAMQAFCLGAFFVLFAACGQDAAVSENERRSGEGCDEQNRCQAELICHEQICRSVCNVNKDCDVLSEHCENGLCLPGSSIACGNRNIDPGESCDDGNTEADDGCDQACKREPGWNCEGEPSDCVAVCGDAYVVGEETCDDDNTDIHDACPSGPLGNCQEASCGDGYVYFAEEECDQGLDNSDAPCAACCRTDCSKQRCGDGIRDIEANEACDSGTDNGLYGYCNTDCTGLILHCGDGVTDWDKGEECDDGNNRLEACPYGETACLVCDPQCHLVPGATSYCGDTDVDDTHAEDCDWGYATEAEVLEYCDYGQMSCQLCSYQCEFFDGITAYCGDGVTDSMDGELCDDNNMQDFDGCASDCQPAELKINEFSRPWTSNLLGKFRLPRPQIAGNQAGDIVVVWEAYESASSEKISIFARLFDKHGVAQSDEIQVNSSSDHLWCAYPAVAMHEDGRFVVVWQKATQESYATHSYDKIAMRFFHSNGDPLVDEIDNLFPTTMTYDATEYTFVQNTPDIVIDEHGNYIILSRGDLYYPSIFLLTPSKVDIYIKRGLWGQAPQAGYELVVDDMGDSYGQWSPQAVMDGSSNLFVGWLHTQGLNLLSDYEIRYKRYKLLDGSSMQAVTPEISINGQSGLWSKSKPSMALDGGSQLLIVWDGATDSAADINLYAARIQYPLDGCSDGNSDGTLECDTAILSDGASDFVLTQLTNDMDSLNWSPGIAMVPNEDSFVVSWSNNFSDVEWDVLAQVFSLQGEALTERFQLNYYMDEYQFDSNVHVDGNSQFFGVWNYSPGSNKVYSYGIFGQRYSLDGHIRGMSKE